LSGHPAHCLDAISARGFQPRLKNKKTGQAVKGLFFGQSSFTHIALVREVSVVPATPLLKDPSSNDELKLFAPMCCGFMTGAGTVINTARPTAETDTLIMGLGGVGMGALMAAKIAGCKTIMAVDRIESRLRLAMELGATATLNTDGCKDLATELETFVKKSTADGYGTGLVIDTTVYMPLIYAALGTLRNGGQIILLGVPRPTDELQIPLSTLFRGALTVRSEFMGDTLPEDFIPRIVEWYRKGQFPIEKMVKYFKAEDMADAVAAMRNGTAIKPILVW
jgi:Zn-dependent alcohol dehydrogenase